MPNTYTQLHVQLVFAVKYRAALIGKEWKAELHKYITGIFQENRHKMLQINRRLLRAFEIEYDERYIFKELE